MRVLAITLWLGTLVLGMGYLYAHEFSAAPASAGVLVWPVEESPLTLNAEHATLLFFAHPRCPCTRNSVAELDAVLRGVEAPVSASMVLMQPPEGDVDPAWSGNALVAGFSEGVGLAMVKDADGALARRFDVAASGTVLVYGPDGALRYRGGVTASRSHAGPGPGVDALQLALSDKPVLAPGGQMVFGCPLRGSESTGAMSP